MVAFINPWPDGLVEPCAICGEQPVQIDYIVDDEFWAEHIEKKYRLDVVCIGCFLEKVGAAGLDHLKILYWTYDGNTIVLLPVKVNRLSD